MYSYIQKLVSSYSLLAILGGFATICVVWVRNSRKYKFPVSEVLSNFVLSVVGGYVGSKLLYAITRIPWLVQNFSWSNLIWLIPNSGLVFYGGLFGVIFVLCMCTRNNPVKRKKMFQLAVPEMPLFHVFGRIGCFITGCCYGKPLENVVHIGSIQIDKIPVQMFEALFEACMCIVLFMLVKKGADVLRIYLISYAVFRFINEFMRGDLIRGIFFGLSTAQWISLMILAFYFYRFIVERKSGKAENFKFE